jgi:hypothetical protein
VCILITKPSVNGVAAGTWPILYRFKARSYTARHKHRGFRRLARYLVIARLRSVTRCSQRATSKRHSLRPGTCPKRGRLPIYHPFNDQTEGV